jgi:hypothetical protein
VAQVLVILKEVRKILARQRIQSSYPTGLMIAKMLKAKVVASTTDSMTMVVIVLAWLALAAVGIAKARKPQLRARFARLWVT